MNYRLVSAIRKEIWNIDAAFVAEQIPALLSFLDGKIEFTVPKSGKPFNLYAEHASGTFVFSEVDENDNSVITGLVAVTNIIGPTMKYDMDCGPIGTIQIGENLNSLDRNPDVKCHVINLDSPGGMAEGCSRLADTIKNLKKPTVAFINGYGCSAAIWYASACDYVMSTPLSLIGSIGSMASFTNIEKKLIKEGYEFHDIYASQSKDKNRIFNEVFKGDYKNYRIDVVDPQAQDFIDNMKVLRPTLTNEHLTGNTWYSKDMVGFLVDELGSFEDALSKAIKMADTKSNTDSNPNTNQNMAKKPYSKLENKLGGPIEMSDGGSFFNADQLQVIEDSLPDVADPAPMVVADPVVVTDPVNTAAVVAPIATVEDPEVTAMKSENASLKLQVTTLQNKLNVAPATTPAAPKVENALFPTVSEAPTAVDEVNSFVKQL